MIRLLTQSLGGEAYLNFMGNEFGHPEWIDFPRPENNYSYHYCRRQWSLAEEPSLRYSQLYAFDKHMNAVEHKFQTIVAPHQYITLAHETDKVIVFEKGNLLFVFNFHPNNSYEAYKVGTSWDLDHKILYDSDRSEFGGFDRLTPARD
jgi:1,4-alpha-glucan branching enzyme